MVIWGKMLVFVSSVGRSGTRYLSELVSHVSGVRGHHVPKPHCTGKVLIDYNNYKDNASLAIKRETVKKSIKGKKYFESSQLFLRCFVEEIFKLRKETNIPLGVIHLTRDPLECARSYTNRNSIPGRPGCVWRLPPGVQKNFLKIAEDLTPYQKNLWDWLENEIRYHHYKSQFDKTYDMYFTDLNSVDKLKEMFNFFDIRVDQDKLANEIFKKRLNRNSNKMKTVVSQQDIKEAKQLVHSLKDRDTKNIFNDSYYKKYEILNGLRGES